MSTDLTSLPAWGSAEYWRDPHRVGAALRTERPAHQGIVGGLRPWIVHRYADVRAGLEGQAPLTYDLDLVAPAILADLRATGHGSDLNGVVSRNLLFMDGADHRRQRKLIASAFTPRQSSRWRERVESITASLFDQTPTGQPVDLIEHVAFPLPVKVICELLGVPVEDRDRFRRWTAAIVEGDAVAGNSASDALGAYFGQLIEIKRRSPGRDLFSELIDATDNGDRLDEGELLATAFLLLIAGHETTTNLIGNTVFALLASGVWSELVANPELAAAAVNEGSRLHSPTRCAPLKVTTRDWLLDGVTIPAGKLVLLELLSANRDPAAFARSDEFDLRRTPDTDHPLLTFGRGRHSCLGKHLAQLEAVVVLRQLIERYPGMRLACAPADVQWKESMIMYGATALPVIL